MIPVGCSGWAFSRFMANDRQTPHDVVGGETKAAFIGVRRTGHILHFEASLVLCPSQKGAAHMAYMYPKFPLIE